MNIKICFDLFYYFKVWLDDRFKYDKKSYGMLAYAHFGADEVWKPDILLHNG